MDKVVAGIAQGLARERVWLLEHPPLYTAGTSAHPADLISPDRFPVFATGRGGQHTYHGPGQRVAYVMLDLKRRGGDCVPMLPRWKGGSSKRWRPSISSGNVAKTGLAYGSGAEAGRTRLLPSASASGIG